ncbi:MAG: 1-acyl-sn-glycerol-3-phosphate acyltransferase [Saprospiraceae bacterium]|nr:1-acyl-sn-glycerol-3-phosphate acyltransferase [Saprospiraceae bacterium]
MDYRLIRQSSGWNYWIFHPVLHVVYRLMFRKIYLHNRKGVKANTPVLIAANHPTAFVDPIFFCIFFDPPVYNMTRGDIFRKPLFRRLMESVNMFPVYRLRDGYEGRDRNEEVFEYCSRKLSQKVAVTVFVEGEHHLDKRVLSPHKGIAKIAFGTYEEHRMEDLQIVPVGCNYHDGAKTRDEAKIIVGAPLMVKDYWQAYQENPGSAINQLCMDVELSLKKICYQVDNVQDMVLADRMLLLQHNQHPPALLPVVEHHATPFWPEKALLDGLNKLPEEQKSLLKQNADQYFSAIEQSGVSDESLIHPEHASTGNLLLLLLLAPLALAGFLISWPIRTAVYAITRRTVKKKEFYTSVIAGVTTILGVLYFFIWMVVGLATGFSWVLTVGILMPVLAWISIFWKETRKRWMLASRALRLENRSDLLRMREEMMRFFPKQ